MTSNEVPLAAVVFDHVLIFFKKIAEVEWRASTNIRTELTSNSYRAALQNWAFCRDTCMQCWRSSADMGHLSLDDLTNK